MWGGEGTRVSDVFYKESKSKNKYFIFHFFLFFSGGGGGGGVCVWGSFWGLSK